MGNSDIDGQKSNRGITVYNVKTKEEMTVCIVGKRMIARRGGIARGYITNVEISKRAGVKAFLLLKGSTVAKRPTASCQVHILNLRKNCTEILTGNVVNRDSLFTSATAASNFVCYGASNGNDMWDIDD